MSNKMYDKLKLIALIILPAITTFIGLVLETLNISWSGKAITIMSGFITMLGTIINKLSNDYKVKKSENGVG